MSNQKIGMMAMASDIRSRLENRRNRLARFYDNGGETADRYTAVYLTPCRSHAGTYFWHRFMSEFPFSPQGIGTSGESRGAPLDSGGAGRFSAVDGFYFFGPPRLGRKHPFLGRRVQFLALPPDVQKSIIQDLSS